MPFASERPCPTMPRRARTGSTMRLRTGIEHDLLLHHRHVSRSRRAVRRKRGNTVGNVIARSVELDKAEAEWLFKPWDLDRLDHLAAAYSSWVDAAKPIIDAVIIAVAVAALVVVAVGMPEFAAPVALGLFEASKVMNWGEAGMDGASSPPTGGSRPGTRRTRTANCSRKTAYVLSDGAGAFNPTPNKGAHLVARHVREDSHEGGSGRREARACAGGGRVGSVTSSSTEASASAATGRIAPSTLLVRCWDRLPRGPASAWHRPRRASSEDQARACAHASRPVLSQCPWCFRECHRDDTAVEHCRARRLDRCRARFPGAGRGGRRVHRPADQRRSRPGGDARSGGGCRCARGVRGRAKPA